MIVQVCLFVLFFIVVVFFVFPLHLKKIASNFKKNFFDNLQTYESLTPNPSTGRKRVFLRWDSIFFKLGVYLLLRSCDLYTI